MKHWLRAATHEARERIPLDGRIVPRAATKAPLLSRAGAMPYNYGWITHLATEHTMVTVYGIRS